MSAKSAKSQNSETTQEKEEDKTEDVKGNLLLNTYNKSYNSCEYLWIFSKGINQSAVSICNYWNQQHRLNEFFILFLNFSPLFSSPLHSTPLHSTLFFSFPFFSFLFFSFLETEESIDQQGDISGASEFLDKDEGDAVILDEDDFDEDDDDVVDLRAFSVVGPVMKVQLLELSPQPKHVAGWTIQQSE